MHHMDANEAYVTMKDSEQLAQKNIVNAILPLFLQGCPKKQK